MATKEKMPRHKTFAINEVDEIEVGFYLPDKKKVANKGKVALRRDSLPTDKIKANDLK